MRRIEELLRVRARQGQMQHKTDLVREAVNLYLAQADDIPGTRAAITRKLGGAAGCGRGAACAADGTAGSAGRVFLAQGRRISGGSQTAMCRECALQETDTKRSRRMKNLIKYLTYRDSRDDYIPQVSGQERWIDRGMGHTVAQIARRCAAYQSDHVLAFSLVINPNPDADRDDST